MTAPTLDFDAAFADITAQLEREAEQRNAPPLVRFWDGDYRLRGECHQQYSASVSVAMNETGTASIDMPVDYYLAEWCVAAVDRGSNVHMTVDRDGWRGGYILDTVTISKKDDGSKMVRCVFKHDYEHLKHILAWSNPWLPAEFQFPKVWVLFGRSRWALKTTLFVNLMRLEGSLWMLPPDPMDPDSQQGLDQSTWTNVVKPDLEPDRSVAAIVHSRFKSVHDMSKKTVADAQLTWTCRRYLDGDPPPWPGANLRHGCLVWDLVDKSGWNTGTSFGGNLFSGLIYELTHIGQDGHNDGFETVPDPNLPPEAFQPGWTGSIPAAPAVCFREGEYTGIQTSDVSWSPATDVRVVSGGHSPDWVNAGFSLLINGIGAAVSQASLGTIANYGPVADALLAPLYTDVVLAFGNWENRDRRNKLGSFHLWEKWADGSDAAYTLSWLLAMRTGMWQTRQKVRATITVADGCPWRVGAPGHGHFFLGDRVGFTCDGTPPGQVWVEQVTELTLKWDRDTAPTWTIQIGEREPSDPIIDAFSQLQEIFSIVTALGV